MKSKKVTNRKSKYDPARGCYLSEDGKFYCYSTWDPDLKCVVEEKLEVGKDLSIEMTLLLDEMDHEMELEDLYLEKVQDPLFKQKAKDFESCTESDDTADPWEEIPDERMAPEAVLFAEERPEDPTVLEVRRVIEEECTESQKELFYAHFGEGMQLSEFSRLEAEKTGKQPTRQAIEDRKRKIIRKISKDLETGKFNENKETPKD